MEAVLAIAGSDSSGGAGIQADVKTIAAHGLFAETAITALTAQNTTGVFGVVDVDPEFVARQIDVVFEDIRPAAVKVGMVSSAGIVRAIAQALARNHAENVVVDPVMVATSGARLISDEAAEALVGCLFPLASVVTPNLVEARALSGMDIADERDVCRAADAIARSAVPQAERAHGDAAGTPGGTCGDAAGAPSDACGDGGACGDVPVAALAGTSGDARGSAAAASGGMGDAEGAPPAARSQVSGEVPPDVWRVPSVLIKGGHSVGEPADADAGAGGAAGDGAADDLLRLPDGTYVWLRGARVDTQNTHGTGCTLSSAIACGLARGQSVQEAVRAAKRYVAGALAAGLDLGRGSGPLDHMWEHAVRR